ncbi:MAG: S-methyl-5-thioribose-1-phosphate isomerase [Deltaproteobacteria bacterium]|nr:S-methyl-5-thioribose-1-phosphate isomerase [Deltaproteobacteria bacterium]
MEQKSQIDLGQLEQVAFAVQWKDDCCVLMDQTKLPGEETYLRCKDYREVVRAIKELIVRGAPAIGVAGAYAVALAAKQALQLASASEQMGFFEKATAEISAARPTASNLRWAVEQMKAVVRDRWGAGAFEMLNQHAIRIHEQDVSCNRAIAGFGAPLVVPGEVITYCNAGELATGGIGTAVGVIIEAFRRGRVSRVYVCETRPVLQGLRLTAWEMHKRGIPFTAICDNMAATVMKQRKVTAVITGADRIAANGDAANKIGTYGLAVLANHHQIPFFVAAPSSTFDLETPTGAQIPIEERSGEEIIGILRNNRPKFPLPVFNPSFDVTPSSLISAIICEKGVAKPPTQKSIADLFKG